MTNNVAEYEALMAAAQWLVDEGIEDKIVIKGDSELVIKQMKGQYKVSSATSKKYVPEIKKLLQGKDVSFSWVPREENEEADGLSRMGYESFLRHKSRRAKRTS
jgi:ribonuclease HI